MPNPNSETISNENDCPSKPSASCTISVKHYDCLISELKCPGCAKPLNIPIKLCEAGHSVCNYCNKHLSACPICSRKITDMRSLTLEALVAKAHFACSNVKNGCTVRMPMDLMQWHKKRCLYNVGDCFMGKVWDDCDWRGCEINWIQHCDDRHNDKIYNETEITLECAYDHFKNTKEPVIGFYIVKAFNEIFNLYQVYDKKHMMMLWTLICTSKKTNMNKNFFYEIELFSPDDPSRLILQRSFCHAENDEDVLNDGRCISFVLSDLLKFVVADKTLHYRFRLNEVCVKEESSINNTAKLRVKKPELLNRTKMAHSVDEKFLVKFPNPTTPYTPDMHSTSVGEDLPFNFSPVSEFSKVNIQNGGGVNQKRKMFQQSMMKKTYNLSMDENDSIDKEIAENIDLKKVMIKEFTIDKHSNEIVIRSPNAVPKPPRQLSMSSSPTSEESVVLHNLLEQAKISSPVVVVNTK